MPKKKLFSKFLSYLLAAIMLFPGNLVGTAFADPDANAFEVSLREAENGTLHFRDGGEDSSRTFAPGEEVVLTLTPAEGYVVQSLSVYSAQGYRLGYAETSDEIFSFDMPALDVEVAAVFEKDAENNASAELSATAESTANIVIRQGTKVIGDSKDGAEMSLENIDPAQDVTIEVMPEDGERVLEYSIVGAPSGDYSVDTSLIRDGSFNAVIINPVFESVSVRTEESEPGSVLDEILKNDGIESYLVNVAGKSMKKTDKKISVESVYVRDDMAEEKFGGFDWIDPSAEQDDVLAIHKSDIALYESEDGMLYGVVMPAVCGDVRLSSGVEFAKETGIVAISAEEAEGAEIRLMIAGEKKDGAEYRLIPALLPDGRKVGALVDMWSGNGFITIPGTVDLSDLTAVSVKVNGEYMASDIKVSADGESLGFSVDSPMSAISLDVLAPLTGKAAPASACSLKIADFASVSSLTVELSKTKEESAAGDASTEPVDAPEKVPVRIELVVPEGTTVDGSVVSMNEGNLTVDVAPVAAAEGQEDVAAHTEYKAFAEKLVGMELEETGKALDFYNTFVDEKALASAGESGRTISDIFTFTEKKDEEYFLSLNPREQVENSPIYKGADGNYYVVSNVPSMQGKEELDHQAASAHYIDLAAAYPDVESLGGGVYKISPERFDDCFEVKTAESDGTSVEYMLGIRIQVLYTYDAETTADYQTVETEITYPDGSVLDTVAFVNTSTASATVQLFNENANVPLNDENYELGIDVNNGQFYPDGASFDDESNTLSFSAGDPSAISNIRVSLKAKKTSVPTANLMSLGSVNVSKTVKSGYIKLGAAPKNLKSGDKFIYPDVAVRSVGTQAGNSANVGGPDVEHPSVYSIPNRDAQSFANYSGNAATASAWVKNNFGNGTITDINGMLMVMTDENINSKLNPGNAIVGKMFGYVTDGLYKVTNVNGQELDLDGTQLLTACMHAWAYEANTTPADVVNAVSALTGTTAISSDNWQYLEHNHLALQCVSVYEEDGYIYSTFIVATSLLGVGGLNQNNKENKQIGFAVVNLAFEKPSHNIQLHKSWTEAAAANYDGYSLKDAQYGIYSDQACQTLLETVTTDANGDAVTTSGTYAVDTTYYVKEIVAPKGAKLSATVYPITVSSTDENNVVNCTEEPEHASISLKKIPANGYTAIIEGNSCYSLQGAVYGVYSDSNCTQLIEQLTTDASGNAVSAQTYYIGQTVYVKEITPSKGYKLSTSKYPVKLVKGANAIQDTETPLTDPIVIRVSKENSMGANIGTATLAGAQFTVRYYDGYYNLSNLPSVPKASAVFETTASATGVVQAWVSDDFKVSGSLPFKDNQLPLGTYTITETLAPEGYLLAGKMSFRGGAEVNVGEPLIMQIYDNNGVTAVSATNEIIVKETPIMSGFTVRKVDFENESVQGDATDLTATLNLYNNDTASVFADLNGNGRKDEGEEFAPGALIMSFTTDASGNYTSAAKLLSVGKYKIEEATDGAPTGYLREGRLEAFFDIESAERVTAQSIADYIMRGGFAMNKVDDDLNEASAQGDATLEGAAFEVVNRSAHDVVVNGQTYQNGQVVYTFTTGAGGVFTSPAKLLPYGTYEVRETASSRGYLLAPTGSDPASVTFTVREENQTIPLTIEEVVIRGSFKFVKVDADTGLPVPQGDAKLVDAEFEVVNRSAGDVYVLGTRYQPGAVVYVFETVDGVFEAPEKLLPYGTYEIRESEAPEGYLNGNEHGGVNSLRFSITEDGQVEDLTDEVGPIIKDAVQRGSFTMIKNDSELRTNTPQGDASLEGAEYNVINRSENSVVVDKNQDGEYGDDEEFAPGEIVFTFRTATDGTYSAPARLLPYGQYDIVEANPSEGYLNEVARAAVLEAHITISEEGETVTLDDDFFEDVIRGGFTFDKRDEESGLNVPLGGGDLAGTYDVINRSEKAVFVDTNLDGELSDEELYAPGEVVFTFTTNADDGSYISPDTLLPYGTYEIVEVTPPTGYMKLSSRNPELHVIFSVREEKESVDVTETVYNYIKRGDVFFTKRNAETNRVMPYIPFRITALDKNGEEIESHIVFTDENGDFNSNSNYVAHTYKTNAGDAAWAEYLQTGTFGEDSHGHIGTWFGLGTTPSDALRLGITGALPYGRYHIEELRCEANEGLALYDDYFTISGEISGTTQEIDPQGYMRGSMSGTVNYGTIYNFPSGREPSIKTEALIQDLESHFGPASDELTIIDTVSYYRVPAGQYTMVATVYDAISGEQLFNEDGTPVSGSKSVNIDESEGYVKVFIDMDASALEGRTIVIFEDLITSDGNTLAYHHDPSDTDQQIHFPSVSTTAKDEMLDDHIGRNGDTDAKVIDVVRVSNVQPGKKVTITGYLMDKATGEKILDENGKEISASKTLTPSEADFEIELEFSVPAGLLNGRTVVVFEDLYVKGILFAAHHDIEDEEQTVYYPEIGTTFVDSESGEHFSKVADEVTLIDTVAYRGLQPNREYAVSGYLKDKETGEYLVDENDDPIQGTTYFTPDAPDGTVDVTYVLNSSALAGRAAVAFEYLYTVERFETTEYNEETGQYEVVGGGMNIQVVAVHEDLEDEGQTVNFPALDTEAIGNTGTHYVHIDGVPEEPEDETVVVSVEPVARRYGYISVKKVPGDPAYGMSIAGAVYGVFRDEACTDKVGELITDETGRTNRLLLPSGIYYVKELVAPEGYELDPTVQSAEIKGKIVKTEPGSGSEQAIPGSGSSEGSATHSEEFIFNEKHTVTDRITYSGLIIGREYTVKGVLMDKETAEPVTIDGQTISSEMTFVPEEANGTIDMHFDFNAAALAGKHLVVFEQIWLGDLLVVSHEDISDEDQTVYIVAIDTNLGDVDTGKNAQFGETVLVDEVHAYGLVPNQEYTLICEIYDKESGASTGAKAEMTFQTGEEVSDVTVVNVAVPIDTSAMAGKTLVAFETLLWNGVEIASHKDINDEDQSVYQPTVDTRLVDMDTASKQVKSGMSIQIDTVDMTNLIPGMTYTLEGALYDKDTKDALGAVSSVTFVAEKAEETIELSFLLDASSLAGKKVVAFETLRLNGKVVAIHHDIEDEDQTTYVMKIDTTATIDEEHAAVAAKDMVLVDRVDYVNAIPGQTYRIVGRMMDKETEKPVMVGGKLVTAEAEFVADSEDGFVNVEFHFDGTNLAGREVVIFEQAFIKEVLVASHEDINDDNQLVLIEEPIKPDDSTKTGDRPVAVYAGLISFISIIMLAVLVLQFKKRRYLR